MEQEYSKREIDDHFKVVGEKIQENINLTTDLNVKVGIQNGRVSKMEGRWIGIAMSGAAAIFLIGIILSLVVYSFKVSQDNLKQSILLEIKK